MKTQRGFGLIPVLVIIGLVLIAGGIYTYLKMRQAPASINLSGFVPVASSTSATTQTSTSTNVPAATQTNTSVSFSATPTSGAAPLSVTFNGTLSSPNNLPTGIAVYDFYVNFGDAQSSPVNCPLPSNIPTNYVYPSSCAFSPIMHTYTVPGTYTAVLIRAAQNGTKSNIGSATVAVTGSSQTSATIDQSSLTQAVPTVSYNGPVITGTASNTGQVQIYVDGLFLGAASVVNNHWSMNIANNKMTFQVGTYPIRVYDATKSTVLASGTLTIQ